MTKNILAIAIVIVLAGCATTRVASIKGACDAFPDPRLTNGQPFAPRGKTRTDDRWVTGQQAVGMKVCGWPKPTQFAPPEAPPGPQSRAPARAGIELASYHALHRAQLPVQRVPHPRPPSSPPPAAIVPTALVTEVEVVPAPYTIEQSVPAEASAPIVVSGIAWQFWKRIFKIALCFTLAGLAIGIAFELYARYHARKLADKDEDLEASTDAT